MASQVLDRIDPGQFEASTGYSMGLLREFRDAYATWLSAQEQQFELSSDCLSRLPSADEVAGCYTNGFEIHAADWNAAAARINTVIALIR